MGGREQRRRISCAARGPLVNFKRSLFAAAVDRVAEDVMEDKPLNFSEQR